MRPGVLEEPGAQWVDAALPYKAAGVLSLESLPGEAFTATRERGAWMLGTRVRWLWRRVLLAQEVLPSLLDVPGRCYGSEDAREEEKEKRGGRRSCPRLPPLALFLALLPLGDLDVFLRPLVSSLCSASLVLSAEYMIWLLQGDESQVCFRIPSSFVRQWIQFMRQSLVPWWYFTPRFLKSISLLLAASPEE